MRPIPDEILKQYPLPCVVPGRPWWKPAEDTQGWLSFERYGPRYMTPGYALVQADMAFHGRADLQESCARMDVEHPAPFPGFRVGQIWVFALTKTPQIVATVHTVVPGDLPGCRVLRSDRLMHVFASLFLQPRALWLLYDPVCPWLAPWGAPEPTEAPQP